MPELYDTIGRGYRELRRPDPHIRAAIHRALGDAHSVVNVGAGAGSYEPLDRKVIAVEPSLTMIRQRSRGAAPVVRGRSDSLPFRDESFDASLAILTVHHWRNRQQGLEELRRASRRRAVILTWDPSYPGFWRHDYFPEIHQIDARNMPTLEELRRALGRMQAPTFRSPTIAGTASWGPTGGGRRRTSMPELGPQCPCSPCCPTWRAAYRAFEPTWPRASGTGAMDG
jgi:SAM-dependent methyltransferase